MNGAGQTSVAAGRPYHPSRCNVSVRVPLALLTAALAAPAAPAAEPGRVRAVVVLDTSDPNLVPGVRKDRLNVERLLAANLPADRFTLDVLQGPSLTRAKVLEAVAGLKPGPADAVFFYYSGHGTFRPETGHTLELRRGRDPLARDDLRKALTAAGAGLTVLLTDCCSDRFPNGLADRGLAPPAPPAAPTPLADKLFFQSRGAIDLTAADKDVAYADDYRGGYFTSAVCTVAGRNANTPLAWKEFAEAVRKETAAIHDQAIKDGVAPKLRAGERLQQPVALAPIPADGVKAIIGVVGMTNPTDGPISLEYRWTDAQKWAELTIPAGGRKALAARVHGETADPPVLKVRVDGRELTLPANPWDGTGTPRFADGRQYRFTPKPPAGPAAKSRVLAAEPDAVAVGADNPQADGLAPPAEKTKP